MAVQKVDREVIAGVGSHCCEYPGDRATDCRQDAAHSMRAELKCEQGEEEKKKKMMMMREV